MSGFRISAKKLFLTYSQVNSEITTNQVLKQLESKYQLGSKFQYVISKEEHKDGGTHFHVIIIQQKKIQIRDSHALDIQYEEQTFHGNYQPIKSLSHSITYVCKDGDYITNISNLQNGELISPKEFIISQVQEKGIEQALIEYYEKAPNKAIAGMSFSALKKQFQDIQKTRRTLELDKVDTPFTLEHFHIDETLQEWINNPNTTLILLGRSGLGKTQFCRALVKSKGLKALFVNHKEDFRRLDSSYNAIIIDDANIHDLEETQLLSIIENRADKTIRVLYDSVNKKANILQIIAMNNKEFRKVQSTLGQLRFARRITIHEPKEPFMININIINHIINVNNSVNINNYSPDFLIHQQEELERAKETQKKILEISQRKDD